MSRGGPIFAAASIAFAIAYLGYARGKFPAAAPGEAPAPTPPTGIADLDDIVIQGIATEADVLARTLYGEARSEGERGMQAVANVILNRLRISENTPGRQPWGETIKEICQAPYQFSTWSLAPWNGANLRTMLSATPADAQFRMAQHIAFYALGRALPDITGGAVNYYAARGPNGISPPDWATKMRRVASIGHHDFFA